MNIKRSSNSTFRKIIYAFSILVPFFIWGEDDYDTMAYRVMNTYSDKIEKPLGVKLIATGGGMASDLHMLELVYEGQQHFNVEQARHLYITVMEGFLKAINSYRQIRPWLHEYPYTSKNVRMRITFHDANGERVPNEYIAYIATIKGTVYYDTHHNNDFRDFHKEPYEEALRIVNAEIALKPTSYVH